MTTIDVQSHYTKAATVHLMTGTDKLRTLQEAMDASGFLPHVHSWYTRSGKSKQDFTIAIKPNIMTASVKEHPSPVYTDPAMVEFLIGALRQDGFTDIAVVEARNVYDYSYTGRDVASVATLVGYTCDGYRIEDLSEQKIPWEYGGVLGSHTVGRTWKEADYRISFAKNKTHWQCYYTGTMKNVYGCLPEWDKMRHYHGKNREFFECCVLILEQFPVHFGFLDAWVSGDGFSGHVRDAKPNHTNTIFASDNIFALDWVMGEKMRVSPEKNSVLKEAMRRWGPLGNITRVGDMTPWSPWTNVQPFVVAALDVLEELYCVSRFFSRAFAERQDPRFPPVSRWQWFYGILQSMTRWIERVFVTKT